MSTFSNIDEILDFAIDGEQAAVDLYNGLAGQAKNPSIKTLFEGYAKEEMRHKTKLEEVKSGKRVILTGDKPVLDLKIADYTVDEDPSPDADYQTVLIFAMKKEKAAFKLYTDLASRVEDAGIRELLLGLAQEEAKHKLHFEIEYDDNILIEN